MKLTKIQKKIIKTKGNLVVRASAGTGKTHTMVTKIAEELKDNKSHKVIAAITFTIKAAQEIKERLSVDIAQQFIGTNNSFVIEEIIKPFLKDVYGPDFDVDMDTDYSNRIESFEDGLDEIKFNHLLSSYEDTNKNFIFDLAQYILENSEACRLFLTSKYFKVYIDEYQDCDKSMHKLFMYLCDNLGIETFVVGDEKQSIYMWRGAYPEAFQSIWNKDNFNKITMVDNFRSCQQIQNYTNLLCPDTRSLYVPIDSTENIIWLNISNENSWGESVLKYIDKNLNSALLRFSNENARLGADILKNNGLDCVYIPQSPIADITTESAWLYNSIASYCILDHYSVYDLISEIPVEGDESRKSTNKINSYLKKVKKDSEKKDKIEFQNSVTEIATYLGYVTSEVHMEKLFETITDTSFHSAFEQEKYNHISITFHSSKGLEFEQVVIFSEDYNLRNMSSIYNHYVASSRAKNKLIIVRFVGKYWSNIFEQNLEKILLDSNLKVSSVVNTINL